MKIAVVVFPGTNCDRDTWYALRHVAGLQAEFVWHEETDLASYDGVILPGGFAYGDYLRAGAIARFSPVMSSVSRFAGDGGLVLGICNGFQVLLEAGLLPGAMLRNVSLRFSCRWCHVRVDSRLTPFTSGYTHGQVLELMIAHGEGNYYAPPQQLAELEARGQIVLRYCDAEGRVTPESNPNGSASNVAGVCNGQGNVFGLMPHPERSCEPLLGSEDGLPLIRSLLSEVARR